MKFFLASMVYLGSNRIYCCAGEPTNFHVPGMTGSLSSDNLICASCAEGVSVQKKAQPAKAGAAKPQGLNGLFRTTAGCRTAENHLLCVCMHAEEVFA